MSTKLSSKLLVTAKRILWRAILSVTLVLSTTYGWRISSPMITTSSPVNNGTLQRLEKTVYTLSHEIGIRNYKYYENLNRSADYIQDSFLKMGYLVEEWAYHANGQEFRNIVAVDRRNDKDDFIVIGAHYDSCFNPGADDNASAVAGLLELARLLKREEVESNILFVAFTNEEPPFFMTDKMGSRVFVEALGKKGITVKLAVILEMIGHYSDEWFSQRYLPLLGPFYPNKGNFIAVVGNINSRGIVDFIQNDFKKNKSFPVESIVSPSFVPGITFSDHSSFWHAKIPAVMITDTAYLRNKNYHTSADTIEKLDFEKMAQVVMGLKKSIVALAQGGAYEKGN